jgi:hypothetical protein
MRNRLSVSPFAGRRFNTLAQNGTQPYGKIIPIDGLVKGKGTDLTNVLRLQKWSKKKLICQTMMLALVDVANSRGDTERADSYWNTFHCFQKIKSEDGRLYGDYCKNRFCPVCCGIRKAEILLRYLPVLQTWESPFFLTLTVKSVTADKLDMRINEMFLLLRRIIAKHRKQAIRGKGFRLVGIRSFECNFNPKKKSYNPHFHIILQNLNVADSLRTDWIREGRKLWGQHAISKAAQNNVRVRDLEDCLVEILKYSSKIFTDPDIEQSKRGGKSPLLICVEAYDTIISAMKGQRIFDRFGFNLPHQSKKVTSISVLNQYKEWKYDLNYSDWLEVDGALTLSGYIAPIELRTLLKDSISFRNDT